MTSLLFNVAYAALLLVASPWLIWAAARKGKYRRGWKQKLFGLVPLRANDSYCVWLHAVSVGEVNLLAPLIAEICRRHADWQLVISTTTATGHALATARYGADHTVFYCPLDFSWAVRKALSRVRPDQLILAELELWPNLIAHARGRGTRIAVINGRLSEHSFHGYQRISRVTQWLLRQLDVIAAQNVTYADRFLALGAPAAQVHVTGSLKFDGAQTDRANPATRRLRALAGFAEDDIVFLAGSTQEPEELLAWQAFRELQPSFPRLRLVIVPRHPERFDAVARLLDSCGATWQRRSRLDNGQMADPRARVLLVDRVGELGAWWGAATIAFVGGSLGRRGGQNMIEPAAYGAAVSFGPETRNFRDIVATLLEAQAAIVVDSGEDLTAFVRRCLEEPAFAADLGRRAQDVVCSQLGATKRTVDLLDALAGSVAVVPSAERNAA